MLGSFKMILSMELDTTPSKMEKCILANLNKISSMEWEYTVMKVFKNYFLKFI